ncbi:hypothetical protein [Polaromonas sp.]|uniref:hypothetical protein n=1 Tax=Polaromonas sp. TaxID=1869339 RepID=UPI00356A34FA
MPATQPLTRRRHAVRTTALLLTSLCASAVLPAYAQFPTVTTRTEIWSGSHPQASREAAERAQWELWQLQSEQQRRQLELTRQQDAQLREQAQRNGTWVPTPPGLSDQERVWRDQHQMQHEVWRQQRQQTRQDDRRIRQDSESPGQRALREQAENRRQQGRLSSGDKR